jgi:hypothetical protein
MNKFKKGTGPMNTGTGTQLRYELNSNAAVSLPSVSKLSEI